MHQIFEEIPNNIVKSALGALIQANMHSTYFDPRNEHWGNMAVLNAAHAGELFLKAIIAQQHPLLIFKNIFDFDNNSSEELDLEILLQKAKSHDFQHLPKMLWAVTKERLPDQKSFDDIRKIRNAIQHFYHPSGNDNVGSAAKKISTEFIYKNIDPLIKKHFGLYAIEYHSDHAGYDYVVANLINSELKFSIPDDFDLHEVNIQEEAKNCKADYILWLTSELERIGNSRLISKLSAENVS
ncbi:hypothetical protein [Pseudovibrio sp. Tun.PSC04-5.I4]|uniref:hypothetical protein n=1 Tax=Pseudovibrio sp. Tun.PSC04-5.I4 TaxID=1798213 RepID=UPI0008886DAA|nr:hypothetical protein [Pseudovibrio sp. Tun.PSC04-5.I4]SDR34097.1 hypothetical protein SAMN04515695_4697 [Pseudovibrio sp. Tun.PSC04-5.I4]